MGTAYNPGVVTNGLVMYLDLGNTAKGFKGQPTTNLISDPFAASGLPSPILTGYEVTLTRVAAPDGIAAAFSPTWIKCVTTQGTAGRVIFLGTYSLTTGVDYNFSYYCYVTDPSITKLDTGSDNAQSTSSPVANYSTAERGKVFRVSGTFRSTSGSQCMGIHYWGGNAATFYITGIQVEQKTLATPVVNGTRSATQSVYDLTSNTIWDTSNTIWSNGLPYFDGGQKSRIVSSDNAAFNTQTPSVEAWIKTGATTQNGFIFEKGYVNTQYALFQEGANIQWRHRSDVGLSTLSAVAANWISTSNWAHIVGTYTSGSRKLYVNGVLAAQDTRTGILDTNNGGQFVGIYGGSGAGAMDYPFYGQIAIVKVYNRVLTPDEVAQNFGALRGRFGV